MSDAENEVDDVEEDPNEVVPENETDAMAAEDEKAKQSAEPEAQKEVLPDEKPWSGEAQLFLGGSTTVLVRFNDSSLPSWLRYIVSDDVFYFQRVIRNEHDANAQSAEAPEVNAESAPEAAAVSTLPVTFDPNLKLVLELTSETESPLTYIAKVYVPPVPAVPEDQQAVDASNVPAAQPTEEEEDAEQRVPSMAAREEPAESPPKEEAKEEGSEIFIDVVTLAANYSPDVLKYCLTLRDPAPVNLGALEEWLKFTVGGSSKVIENFILASKKIQNQRRIEHEEKCKAQSAVLAAEAEKEAEEAITPQRPPPAIPFSPLKLPLDFSWIFEKISANPKKFNADLSKCLLQLLESNYVPTKHIDSSLLRNPFAARAYIKLLALVPRSVLSKWTAPLPTPDEATQSEEKDHPPVSSILGNIMLDLRRRNARARCGKAPLRSDALKAHKAFFPKELEVPPVDPISAKCYAPRKYAPHELQLFSSDVALLALGLSPGAFSLNSFVELLDRKTSIAREPFANAAGVYHVLHHSIGLLDERCAVELIRRTPQSTFATEGLVDAAEWVSETLDESFRFVDEFAKRFWMEFVSHKPPIMDAVKTKCLPLHTKITENEDLHKKMISSISSGDATLDFMKGVEEAIGVEAVASPHTMYVAIERRNSLIVQWLYRERNVRTVKTAPGSKPVPVIEHAIRTVNIPITKLLVELGADLTSLWEEGQMSGIAYIQDHWVTEVRESTEQPHDALSAKEHSEIQERNKAVAALFNLFHSRTHERATDPSLKYGLCLA